MNDPRGLRGIIIFPSIILIKSETETNVTHAVEGGPVADGPLRRGRLEAIGVGHDPVRHEASV